MIERVQYTIDVYQMLAEGQSVVAAVSGGPDSVAMLDCLVRLGYRPIVAHLNHLLRGEAAQGDEDFVRALARERDLPVCVKRVDVRSLAREKGVSIEEAGRGARYLFFGEVMERRCCLRTALAHHRDDQAETVLLHMLRGSGPEGLKGMLPVRDGVFIRPLLYVSRDEILDYCEGRGLSYREDASNADTDYARNRVRHDLLPVLTAYNPRVREALCRTAEILREEDACMAVYARRLYGELASLDGDNIRFDIEALAALPPAMMRRMVRKAAAETGGIRDVRFDHIERVLGLLGGQGGAVQLPGGVRAEVRGSALCFLLEGDAVPCPPYAHSLSVPGSVSVTEAGVRICCELAEEALFDDDTVCVDADKIEGPLWVRNRRPGDRFFPYKAPGQKKLKDFLIDQKIPRRKRDTLPLVTDKKGIIWVAGLRTGHDYRVDDGTKRILKLHMHVEQ